MRSMTWFVRACAFYNICGALSLVTPGLLERFGVARPGSPFWLWLPALIGGLAAIVLFLSSSDLLPRATERTHLSLLTNQ